MARDFERPDKKYIEAFRKLPTATISDALDKLGIMGGCLGITPIIEGKKIVGPAVTLKYEPVGLEKGTVGDYMEEVQPGDVIVIDNGGRLHCTVWGDILTLTAVKKGVEGTVIDGVCRDVPKIRELSYPIFTKGRFMVTGKDRVQLEAMNVPVALSNVRVHPGDLIIGDDSGIVVVPKAKMEEVLELAQKIEEAEGKIEEAVMSGMSLTEARKKFKYHELQRKQ